MLSRTRVLACAALALAVALNVHLAAQTGITLTGRLVNSLSGDPISGATVQIDELRRTTTSGADGTFAFQDVPAGTYHVSVHSQGYSARRIEIMVSTTAAPQIDFSIDPELHFEEVDHCDG